MSDFPDPSLQSSPGVVTTSSSSNVGASLLMGIIAGLVAAIIGAAIWAGIVAVTKFQSGIVAIVVGALVGYAVRFFGRGRTPIYGVIGGVFSLLAVLLGNFLVIAYFFSIDPSIGLPFGSVVTQLLSHPDVVISTLQATTGVIDLLFYAIAIYEGYRFATGASFGRRRRR
jgi:hypothetical protein